ncbi:BREX-1 system adenine-specific DNA-methyltransferase PglX [Arthrobacter sp. RCC_34]|uniref:BREX-1 system adenine-specific DNA-methyltransferase PglX n=1 Tax=Arthrobacter sp. RCC_34 TaxID=3239230 RepID=UPI00352501D1
METAPLKSFATSARTELIREVSARITAVLAQGSPERVEQPKAVSALERTIADSGGGDKGKAHVADKVAYTWFNRIIALRFMDANRYTGIGVVSPAADQVGQPEVLAAAKRGQIDQQVVKEKDAATVIGLLNGTRQPRPGVDAQAEAYALLLADYCRFWNAAMPFMFEREGDYTELLIPANLLAYDSVLNRSVAVLTEDVCQDVEVIGWLYQFYISERKDEVFAGFKKNKKAGAEEIPAATQLFTPDWIVRYLVENSLGRLWMLNRPSSSLVSHMEYYIAPVDEETDFLKIGGPEELKVIDPACGSGHMLTYAFDLLYAIYEEEGYASSEIPALILKHNLFATEIDPRAGALASFALTMKAAARRKLFLRSPVEPNICVLEPIRFSADELDYLVTKDGDRQAEEAFWNQFAGADALGSLIAPDPALFSRLASHLPSIDDGGDISMADALDWARQVLNQAIYLLPHYSVAVANPPYMGGKNLGPVLSDFARVRFPDAKADLFAMFIERCVSLVVPSGFVGMITMQSWMFLSSFEALRERLLSRSSLEVLAHLGSGAFDSIGGDVVSTVSFVLSTRPSPNRSGIYFNLTANRSELGKAQEALKLVQNPQGRHVLKTHRLLEVPGTPIAYWLSERELNALVGSNTVADEAVPRKGLVTLNDARFTRRWYEVSGERTCLPAHFSALGLSRKWYPLNKGGGYRRWYGLNETLINWENNGQELKDFIVERYGGGSYTKEIRSEDFYFRESATWAAVSSGPPSFRYTPPGFIFSSGGSSLFSDTSLLSVMGSLNSAPITSLLQTITPTMNFVPGDVARMPVYTSTRLDEVVRAAIDIAQKDWDDRETSWDFVSNQLVRAEGGMLLRDRVDAVFRSDRARVEQLRDVQVEIDEIVSRGLRLLAEAEPVPDVDVRALTIDANDDFVFADESETNKLQLKSNRLVRDFVSYVVGCIFGRYSLDVPGLILADQGATLQEYLLKVPTPTFTPDVDNVIPIVDGDWFEDDVVGLFRGFLRTAFGELHFEENLSFVTESLGVRTLRDYFVTKTGKSKFYDDHVQRYKKRPIYWLFSSPKGSFNALIYMHRYTPSTVSTVLTYLREYVTKLESALQQAERAANTKEADRLRKILVELNEYEHDILYPKASENIVIDLDDGVKSNYPKFGAALRKIAGLEASGD